MTLTETRVVEVELRFAVVTCDRCGYRALNEKPKADDVVVPAVCDGWARIEPVGNLCEGSGLLCPKCIARAWAEPEIG